MVPEPDGQMVEIPDSKVYSPTTIERKMSVVVPPNLQELNIPLDRIKSCSEQREKKISRFLVSPVVDKGATDESPSSVVVTEGLAKGLESSSTKQIPSRGENPGGNFCQDVFQDNTVSDQLSSGGRKCSAMHQPDVNFRNFSKPEE